MKILYVDDESINLKVFKLVFGKRNEVITADDGFMGLEKLKENPDVNVVVSDMRMPHLNGVEFIKKAKMQYPEIRYYIFTGYEINEEIEQAIKENYVLQCFNKPLGLKELEKLLS